MRVGEVAAYFSAVLGEEKSAQLVSEGMSRLGLRGDELSREQVLAVLEHLAEVPGLVGVTARFAMARQLLRR